MKPVAKYNLLKGASTVLTVGTPIATLACCGDFIVHRSDTALSAAGVVVLIISVYLLKDKLAEKFKPKLWAICLIGIALIEMIKSIIMPVEMVLIATAAATGLDAATFSRFYKQLYPKLGDAAIDHTFVGYVFTTSQKLAQENEVLANGTE